jgi:hypothetical protein
MLGEILGSSAGETSWFPDPRFFTEARDFRSDCLRDRSGLEIVLIGDVTVLVSGDGFAVVGVLPPILRDADLGLFLLADILGVASPFATAVSIFGKFDLGSTSAASGSSKSSSIGRA